VIILSLGLEVVGTEPSSPCSQCYPALLTALWHEGRPDIIIDLSKPGALEKLNQSPFTIKEGATFQMKVRFKVQHQILSGLQFLQIVSRLGVKNKMSEMLVCTAESLCGHSFC